MGAVESTMFDSDISRVRRAFKMWFSYIRLIYSWRDVGGWRCRTCWEILLLGCRCDSQILADRKYFFVPHSKIGRGSLLKTKRVIFSMLEQHHTWGNVAKWRWLKCTSFLRHESNSQLKFFFFLPSPRRRCLLRVGALIAAHENVWTKCIANQYPPVIRRVQG